MTPTLTTYQQTRLVYWCGTPAFSVKERIPQILEFLQLATHWSSDRTAEKLFLAMSNSLSAYATCDGDRIVGFGRIIGDGYHLAVLTDIACHPNYRGQAIATNIVKALIADVPHCCTVRAMTSQAKGLYQKLGFCEYSGDTMELTRV